MDFTESSYFRLGCDFGLDDDNIEPVDAFPDGLTVSLRVVDEVLETFVSLHLKRVTGLPLEYVGRGHRNWAGEDLLAWDQLGRIHLFELKKTTINEQVIGQLMQYTMRHLFRPVADFVEKKWGERQATVEDGLATYLAGAYANERTTKLGCSYVVENLPEQMRSKTGYQGDWPISQYWWNKQDISKKTDLIFDSLLQDARRKKDPAGDEFDSAAVRRLAAAWTKRLGVQRRPPRPKYQAMRPVVLWLVAPNVTDGAIQKVREWRALGLDARVVNVDLRKPEDDIEFYVRLRREKFIERDKLEHRILEKSTTDSLGDRPPRVELHFYESSSPSASGSEDEGRPLAEPWARVEEIQKTSWERIST